MDDRKASHTLRPLLIPGVLLPFFLFSFVFMQTILLYGEQQNATAAVNATWIPACIALLIYTVLEFVFLKKHPHSVLFSLSYFMSFALLAALFFHFVTTANLTVIFDRTAVEAKSVLLTVSFRLCAIHAAALLLRIGYEIYCYVRHLSR